MSIILEGIDLPEEVNGTKLTLELYVRSDGKVLDDDLEEIAKAIQIPKGHGRIGDLDELQKAIRKDIMGGLNYEYFIRNAPTILESEENDEHNTERD